MLKKLMFVLCIPFGMVFASEYQEKIPFYRAMICIEPTGETKPINIPSIPKDGHITLQEFKSMIQTQTGKDVENYRLIWGPGGQFLPDLITPEVVQSFNRYCTIKAIPTFQKPKKPSPMDSVGAPQSSISLKKYTLSGDAYSNGAIDTFLIRVDCRSTKEGGVFFVRSPKMSAGASMTLDEFKNLIKEQTGVDIGRSHLITAKGRGILPEEITPRILRLVQESDSQITVASGMGAGTVQ